MSNVTKFGVGLGALALASIGYGSISFNIAAGTLRDSNGVAINSGLVILGIDNNGDGFLVPNETGFLPGGDDHVVASWNFSEGGGLDGEFLASKVFNIYNNLEWTPNRPLALFWFPDSQVGDVAPEDGHLFGAFAPAADEHTTGDPWLMPEDGSHLYSLQFFAEGSLLNSVSFETSYVGSAALKEGEAFDPDAVVGGSVANQPSLIAGRVEWTPVAAAQQYRIERKSSSGEWQTVGYASGGSSSFDDPTISPGLKYVYQVVAESAFGETAAGDFTNALEAARSLFRNLSSRASIDPNSADERFKLLNAGIVIAANDPSAPNPEPKKIMALGIGNYHNEHGSSGWVDDTTISHNIFGDPTILAENDNWTKDPIQPTQRDVDADALKSTMVAVSALYETPVFEDDDTRSSGYVSTDAALLMDLPVDTRNLFKVRSAGSAGFVGVGVYDAETDPLTVSSNRIINLSNRGYMTDGGVFNAGVIIEGEDPNLWKEVLVLASGPRLGGASYVSDPWLSLRKFGEGEIATNDDWTEQTAVPNQSKGLLAVETNHARILKALQLKFDQAVIDSLSLDSVLLVKLLPGKYIFRVFANPEPAGAGPDYRTYGDLHIAVHEIEME